MPILSGDESVILESKAEYEGGGGIKLPGKKKGNLFERKDGSIGKVKFKISNVSEWIREIHMMIVSTK